jgi:hypothetical protein
MREYLRDKINEHQTNSKNKKNPRRINEFKSGCQPRSNVMEDKMAVCLQPLKKGLVPWS